MKFTVNGRKWDSENLMGFSFGRNRVGGLWHLSYTSGSAGGSFGGGLVETKPGVFRSATEDEQHAEQEWYANLHKRYRGDSSVAISGGPK